jgi:hypothetical protein
MCFVSSKAIGLAGVQEQTACQRRMRDAPAFPHYAAM